MGIVLKRRDNCNAVKDIYGGLVDILMNEQNVGNAVDFVKQFLSDMVNEKFGLDKLIISKSLRGFYKNPDSIAHKVLADRMGKREPGNKPSVGSRIPYVYIQTKGEVKLQGDKIENPDYIKKHNHFIWGCPAMEGVDPDMLQAPVQLYLVYINEA